MSRTNPSTVRVPVAVESAVSAATINIGTARQTSAEKSVRSNRVLLISKRALLNHRELRTTMLASMTVFLLIATNSCSFIYKRVGGFALETEMRESSSLLPKPRILPLQGAPDGIRINRHQRVPDVDQSHEQALKAVAAHENSSWL